MNLATCSGHPADAGIQFLESPKRQIGMYRTIFRATRGLRRSENIKGRLLHVCKDKDSAAVSHSDVIVKIEYKYRSGNDFDISEFSGSETL